CLSPNVAGQPLSPATDRRLGGPLPRQLANQTRGHLRAINLWQSEPCDSTASCGISTIFTVLFPTPRQVPHALLTRPPLRNAIHWTNPDRKSTRLNSSHVSISYAVFCLKKKNYQNSQQLLD